MQTNTYQLHPLCTLFPRLQNFDFECLKLDIQKNGQREPIILHEGMIIDGQNRYAACQSLRIEPQFMQYAGDDIASYVLSANLHRRHLTPGQQAVIVASVQDWEKAQTPGGDRKSTTANSTRSEKDTLSGRAEKSGASKSTQQKADAVAKANPGLAAQVARGEVSLNDATREVAPQLAPKKKAAPTENPAVKETVTVDDSEHEESNEDMLGRQNELLRESNHALNEELVALRDKKLTDGNVELEKTLFNLRNELKILKINYEVVIKSRDALMNENSQLKRQDKISQSRIKKLEEKLKV